MDTNFVLVPEEEGKNYGIIKPVDPVSGQEYGLSVGHWIVLSSDNRIHIILKEDIDSIIHETATTKAIRAELRAAERDNKGVEIKPTIILDPVTRRFKQVYP